MNQLFKFIEQEVKYRRTEIAKQDFDTVFIGSSRTSYSVIPPYFDAITEKRTRSYNFGINSGFPPQTFDWAQELIETKASLKYVFFELSEHDLHASDVEELWQVAATQLDARLSRFVISALKPRMSAREDKIDHRKPDVVFREFSDDYNIPLAEALEKEDKPADEFVSPAKINLSFVRNKRIETGDADPRAALDEQYWNRILGLIRLAETKQIRIYFFIPPRLASDAEFKKIYPVYQKLDRKYKLRVPLDGALYQIDTSLDDFHLNHKGAKRFTELLAAAFDEHAF